MAPIPPLFHINAEVTDASYLPVMAFSKTEACHIFSDTSAVLWDAGGPFPQSDTCSTVTPNKAWLHQVQLTLIFGYLSC